MKILIASDIHGSACYCRKLLEAYEQEGAERKGDILILNPGSVSIPKEGNPPACATMEKGAFRIKDFDGNVVKEITR